MSDGVICGKSHPKNYYYCQLERGHEGPHKALYPETVYTPIVWEDDPPPLGISVNDGVGTKDKLR